MKIFLSLLLLAGVCRAANLTQFTTADELWKHIEQLQEGPATRPQSEEEMVTMIKAFAGDVVAATTAFETRYPTDPRRWESRVLRIEVGLLQNEVTGQQPDHAAVLSDLETVAAAEDISPFAKRKAKALARQVRQQQAAAAKLKELQSKPLELKFTAVDGAEVDLAKLRGKVVLVDFWATWCGPCVLEAPNVVATYRKYRPKGFEIVGISLDKDKEQLLAFAKKAGMTWPQYFDGKVWENEISTRFAVRGIPAMWLVDKQGFVRETNARGSTLAAQVEKLLAE